jgi:hypothetical protein
VGPVRRARDSIWTPPPPYLLTSVVPPTLALLLMTLETPELLQLSRVSEAGMSHLSDNVLLLQYVHRDLRLKRALTVLKTRASRHDPAIREYEIGPTGIVLQETP